MPRSIDLPPHLSDSFGIAEAIAAGASRSRLDDDDLERLFHGARIRVDAPHAAEDLRTEWDLRAHAVDRMIRAYTAVMPSHAFFCGPTAAHIWGIPLPARIDGTLHVGVWRPRRAPKRARLKGHQHTPGFVRVIDEGGVRVTDPASTWATLGSLLFEDELVAAADAVIRTPRYPGGFQQIDETPLATIAELWATTERKGRPGAPRLRSALELARDGVSSPPETQIRLIIRDAGLPEPALDFDVRDEHGRFLGCSELAYPELKIAIEYESDGHLTREQLQRDIDKYQAYAEAGWKVVRLTSQHVHRDRAEAVRRIRAARAASRR